MDSQSPSPACPLTDDQIAHAADQALRLGAPSMPAPASPALARFHTILGTLAQPPLEPAPESLIARLIALPAATRPGLVERVADLATNLSHAVRTVLATLTFDSRVSPALAGFRGSASAIQLAFTSEAGDLHLQVSEPEAPDTLITLRAAFEPADPSATPAGTLSLTRDHASPISASIDEDGMATLRVQAGTYHARLETSGLILDLGHITIP